MVIIMRRLITMMALVGMCICAFSQAKKPKLMVVPSDLWCNENGFVQRLDNIGKETIVPNYEAAFQNNGELKVVITTLGDLMQERGFELVDMEQSIKSLTNVNAEDMLATSKSGAMIAETPLDKLKKVAKSDIILELYWKVNYTGPRKSVTYNLRALDAYTNKQIGSTTGTSEPSMTGELAVMLQEAAVGGIEKFNSGLMNHFTDMEAKGREVALNIKVWADYEKNLESDCEGRELNELIEDWVAENTVNGVYSLTDATETMMNFDQVRIPLYVGGTGRAMDARNWGKGLAKLLDSKGIPNKLSMRGLGQVTIIIGGK